MRCSRRPPCRAQRGARSGQEQGEGGGLVCFAERILSCWPLGRSKIFFFSIEKLKSIFKKQFFKKHSLQ